MSRTFKLFETLVFTLLVIFFFNGNRQWDCSRTSCQCCAAEMLLTPILAKGRTLSLRPCPELSKQPGIPCIVPHRTGAPSRGKPHPHPTSGLTSCCTLGGCHKWHVVNVVSPCSEINTNSGWDSLSLKASKDTTPAPPFVTHPNAKHAFCE